MKYREYYAPATLEEAWQLNQKKSNRIIAGGMWLRLRKSPLGGVIDISGLGLDKIEETETEFIIGSMVTLHDIECHPGLNAIWGEAISEALSPIVGVQFRNCATVGGSIYGRFGFSDVFTLFVVMDARIKFYKTGEMYVKNFSENCPVNDILTHIIVKKSGPKIACMSQRTARTDFPVLTAAVADDGKNRFACVGARPMRAVRIDCPDGMDAASFAEYVAENVTFGTNARASGAYRKKIAKVLMRRCCEKLGRTE